MRAKPRDPWRPIAANKQRRLQQQRGPVSRCAGTRELTGIPHPAAQRAAKAAHFLA